MLFVPTTTLSTGTVNLPFSSVVVEYTLPLTVTLTGVFGTAFPSWLVKVPFMLVGSPTTASVGNSRLKVPLLGSTFALASSLALSYFSFPAYSTLTSFVPTLSVGKVAVYLPFLSVWTVCFTPSTETVTSAPLTALPFSSSNLPLTTTSSPTNTSSIGSIVMLVSNTGTKNLSFASSTS